MWGGVGDAAYLTLGKNRGCRQLVALVVEERCRVCWSVKEGALVLCCTVLPMCDGLGGAGGGVCGWVGGCLLCDKIR